LLIRNRRALLFPNIQLKSILTRVGRRHVPNPVYPCVCEALIRHLDPYILLILFSKLLHILYKCCALFYLRSSGGYKCDNKGSKQVKMIRRTVATNWYMIMIVAAQHNYGSFSYNGNQITILFSSSRNCRWGFAEFVSGEVIACGIRLYRMMCLSFSELHSNTTSFFSPPT
jgi:hypothetical protein